MFQEQFVNGQPNRGHVTVGQLLEHVEVSGRDSCGLLRRPRKVLGGQRKPFEAELWSHWWDQYFPYLIQSGWPRDNIFIGELLLYSEIVRSDWLNFVTWLVTSNHYAFFQSWLIKIVLIFFISDSLLVDLKFLYLSWTKIQPILQKGKNILKFRDPLWGWSSCSSFNLKIWVRTLLKIKTFTVYRLINQKTSWDRQCPTLRLLSDLWTNDLVNVGYEDIPANRENNDVHYPCVGQNALVGVYFYPSIIEARLKNPRVTFVNLKADFRLYMFLPTQICTWQLGEK